MGKSKRHARDGRSSCTRVQIVGVVVALAGGAWMGYFFSRMSMLDGGGSVAGEGSSGSAGAAGLRGPTGGSLGLPKHVGHDVGLGVDQFAGSIVPADRTTPKGGGKGTKFVDHMDKYDLRGLHCRSDWNPNADISGPICRSPEGVNCPNKVTPAFLDAADGQGTCQDPSRYFCRAECVGDEVRWSATPCGQKDEVKCPPKGQALPGSEISGLGLRGAGAVAAAHERDKASGKTPKSAGEPVVNLRGLKCETKSGMDICFYEDEQGRELCPEYVTPEYLTRAPNQHLCSAEATTHFCTASCQTGHPEIHWHAHEIAWCSKNQGCPPQPPLIPVSEYEIGPWSEKPRKSRQCFNQVPTVEIIPKVSVGMLVFGDKELQTMRDTLQTYEQRGLFAGVSEFIIYLNARSRILEEEIEPYQKKFPNIVIAGDKQNRQITGAINAMVDMAKEPYLLFLEKDFQLIDPWSCVVEQLLAGVEILDEGKAHAIRYRSRDRPGRPNWADRMFRGHEEDAFKNGQPNLVCNHYYWIPDPDKRWPDVFKVCYDKTSRFYCSDSFYCNWTNNPTLFPTKWWREEYMEKRFVNWKNIDPIPNLEPFMNWEPGSWNDEHFVVAQGDGLFRHVDRRNFGI